MSKKYSSSLSEQVCHRRFEIVFEIDEWNDRKQQHLALCLQPPAKIVFSRHSCFES